MTTVVFDRRTARAERVRTQAAEIAPWLLTAATLTLGLNWLLVQVRSDVLQDDVLVLAAIVFALLALVPVVAVVTRRGLVERSGLALILFVSTFASGAGIVTNEWIAGGALNLAFCGLLAVVMIFIWPRTWHFVVGTAILLGIPTIVLILGSPDRDAAFRGVVFAVNCLLLNLAVFLLVKRTRVREDRVGQATTWQARHDGLTELLNRNVWIRQSSDLLARSRTLGTTFWVLVIDLDRFKVINDTHGHAAGDAVLVRLSVILSDAVEELGRPAFAGRLGGDEFGMAVSGSNQIEIDALIQRLADRYRLANGYGDRTSLSVGTAISADGESLEGTLDRADQAMYAIKRRSRPDPDRDDQPRRSPIAATLV